MVPGFDRLPALATPIAQRWAEYARLRRTATVGMAELLPEFRRLGVLPDLDRMTVIEFGVRHGLSATEAREIADVSVAVEKMPELKEDVCKGDVSVHAARQLGRMAKEGVSQDALEDLRAAAKEIPAEALKKVIDHKIEEMRTGVRVVERSLGIPEDHWTAFGRTREIASKEARTCLTEGQTFSELIFHYLGCKDPDRVKPRRRRMEDTRGKPGRHHPAEVKREVLGRTGGQCIYPACTNRIWVQMAHRVPHAQGGSREADNTWGLCFRHHVRYDGGEFTIEGPIDAPVFYDAKHRRIRPNGRIDESDPGRDGLRAPP